ncbi:ATP-dependent helicase [Pseudonocardia bannensis]|uniref:ATP-dependent helicase n=1 Tax=Pseudonocardia bannensis TaxID=630973 RepID=UPI001FE3E872|nr:ATP-dependent DNA helicase [Pseudonocardia bannensis]
MPAREPEWDEAARRVLEHRAGPLRVVGGPGTGKTTLLLASVARRVREGVDPERILLLVGSRRAAGELRERLTEQLHVPGHHATTGGIRTSRETLVRTVHSYAFGVLRLHAARNDDPPPRLLASAEQDALVRDLLAGELAGAAPDSGWPDRLRPALGLPGFAAELRELLLRAAERGLGPDGLTELGHRHEVPEWVAAGRFFRSYEHVIMLRGAAGRGAPQATAPALDSAELVSAALDALAADPELLAAERERVRHLLVDDAQDLDPQQMELVRALGVTAETTLLAGDPDQAVLNFRGADPAGLRAMEVQTAVLTVDHRSADELRAAAARLVARLPGAGEGRERVAPPRDVADESRDPGSVRVRVFSSPASEAGWVADQLRRAHLNDGVPWSEMAVLARSTRRALPALRRALVAAGVPISAPPDELPLARQPAVLPLLLVLRAATRPEELDADAATALLTSSLGSGDPMRMRRLRRGLLRLHAAGQRGGAPDTGDADAGATDAPPASPGAHAAADGAGQNGAGLDGAGLDGAGPSGIAPDHNAARHDTAGGNAVNGAAAHATADDLAAEAERSGSDPLLVEALRSAAYGRPDPLAALPPNETAPLRRVGALLATAGAAARDGQSVEEVLWRVWQQSGLAQRWAEASARGGPVGAAADRDLDAVLALFDAAARYTDRLPGADVAGFTEYLADQQLPGDTLAPQTPRGEAVSLLTAHAARGREWQVVAVPGVQEGSWPDLRLRGSLLGSERLVDLMAGVAEPGPGGADTVSRIAPLLAEERRLFYLACTRAKQTLLVSAVQGEDEQPSRFLDELDPVPAGPTEGRVVHKPARALVLAELVGELRRAVCEPDNGDPVRADRRRRAAAQLARLAAEGVPGAHPRDWYGLAPPSTEAPLRVAGEVVPVSPSDVEKIVACPLRWVLERHGGGEVGALAAVTGSLVHALVQASAAGADRTELEDALRSAWSRLDTGAPWFGRRELRRVRAMLAAFDDWVRSSRAEGLRLVAVEHPVQLDLAGPDPESAEPDAPGGRRGGPWLRLRGRVDRLEVDAQGRPVVVDVKTGKTAVSARQAAEHPQLAVYQLAAALGAFSELVGADAPPGGARLVYLADRKAAGQPKEPSQPPLDEAAVVRWRETVEHCAEETSGATFVARVGPDCDRCPVRTSCPAVESGRPVTDG